MRNYLVCVLCLAFASDVIQLSSATIFLKSMSMSFSDLPAKFGNSFSLPRLNFCLVFACREIWRENLEEILTGFFVMFT